VPLFTPIPTRKFEFWHFVSGVAETAARPGHSWVLPTFRSVHIPSFYRDQRSVCETFLLPYRLVLQTLMPTWRIFFFLDVPAVGSSKDFERNCETTAKQPRCGNFGFPSCCFPDLTRLDDTGGSMFILEEWNRISAHGR